MEEQIKLKQLIEHLQKQLKEHGNLPVYYCDDAVIGKQSWLPKAVKIYSYKSYDMLNSGNLEEKDEDLYDVNLEKPIIKGIIV
ncbi:hypothetical protein JK635_02450 [Neobacillus sp. YIM B02564]|uniref:Uncharacterized protein n=1 Tax=Neobacillus paridis TaxID=2803862 RepID=A0ABS1TLC8_9BACI|nr:hypothetical protein [Neobacillus paridis]MBL4951101.1 hypothetical protein [Neobacillus paridis]